MKQKHIGSKLEDMLQAEGILDECRETALRFKARNDRNKRRAKIAGRSKTHAHAVKKHSRSSLKSK